MLPQRVLKHWPELERVRDAAEREALWREFRRLTTPITWMAVVIGIVAYFVPFMAAFILAESLGGNTSVFRFASIITGAVIAGVSQSLIHSLGHREKRAVLRAMLNERGVPTCMACGYDLTGCAALDRCVECGKDQPTRPRSS